MSGQSRQSINVPLSPVPRKRTMSFSTPQSTKSARTLRRTGSYLSLADMQTNKAGTSASHISDCSSPYIRPPRHHKERRRSATFFNDQYNTIHIQPSHTPSPPPKPIQYPLPTPFRTTSPLAPMRSVLPPRASFPRSRPEPDLYRVAITTRMRMSAEGQKILHMGSRLAFSIHNATRELERIVASQRDTEGDVIMADAEGVLSSSWVVLDDWEMVDDD